MIVCVFIGIAIRIIVYCIATGLSGITILFICVLLFCIHTEDRNIHGLIISNKQNVAKVYFKPMLQRKMYPICLLKSYKKYLHDIFYYHMSQDMHSK